MKCKHITKAKWENETAISNHLFAEADRLNEIAYALLNDRPTSADTIKRFQEAKSIADAKYEEAHQAWTLARARLREDVKSLLIGANIDVFEPEDIYSPMQKKSKRT